jgi:6-phosphogluconolactonase
MHPAGRWLYVSNRGHNSITVFEIRQDGHLQFVQSIPSPVDMPREFSIEPSGSWLVVGGQKDGAIASMKINGSDGTLTPADRVATDFIPVSFSFLP